MVTAEVTRMRVILRWVREEREGGREGREGGREGEREGGREGGTPTGAVTSCDQWLSSLAEGAGLCFSYTSHKSTSIRL